MVTDDDEQSREDDVPSPNLSNEDMWPDQHKVDPVSLQNTEAGHAPGRRRVINLFGEVWTVAGSDPMHGLKDFDRIYSSSMEGFGASFPAHGDSSPGEGDGCLLWYVTSWALGWSHYI